MVANFTFISIVETISADLDLPSCYPGCIFLSSAILSSAILSSMCVSLRYCDSQMFLILRRWEDKQLGHNFNVHILLNFINDTSLSHVAVNEELTGMNHSTTPEKSFTLTEFSIKLLNFLGSNEYSLQMGVKLNFDLAHHSKPTVFSQYCLKLTYTS